MCHLRLENRTRDLFVTYLSGGLACYLCCMTNNCKVTALLLTKQQLSVRYLQ